jgi:hypothetical protein
MGKTTAALSLAFMISLAGQSFATVSFTDIGSSSAKVSIEALQAKGVIDGMSDSMFAPQEKLLFAQGITMIMNGLELTADSKAAPAAVAPSDTQGADDAWYAKAFAIAQANGFELPADLDPQLAITKEQYVHYLIQAIEKTAQFPMIKLVPVTITDEEQMTVEFQGSIQRALHYKLVTLDGQGNFNPDSLLTREDAATILYKAVQLYDEQKEKMKALQESANGESADSAGRWMHVPEGVIPADNE